MSEWLDVNGAKIEKSFLEENIREANDYDWIEIDASTLPEHVHCMICGITIDPKSSTKTIAYKSRGGYMCAYCHDHFLK